MVVGGGEEECVGRRRGCCVVREEVAWWWLIMRRKKMRGWRPGCELCYWFLGFWFVVWWDIEDERGGGDGGGLEWGGSHHYGGGVGSTWRWCGGDPWLRVSFCVLVIELRESEGCVGRKRVIFLYVSVWVTKLSVCLCVVWICERKAPFIAKIFHLFPIWFLIFQIAFSEISSLH